MKSRRRAIAAILAAMFSLGIVACEVDDNGGDPLLDDGTDPGAETTP